MRSRIGIAVTVLLAVCSVASAELVATAQLTGAAGNLSNITVFQSAADQALTFEIQLWSSQPILGAQMRLQSLDGAGIFNITGVTFDNAAGWGMGGFVNGQDAADPLLVADSMTSAGGSSSELLGALATGDAVGPGTTRFATLTVALLGGTGPGLYDLNLADLIVSDANGDDILAGLVGVAGTGMTVEVLPIPAPPAIWLAGMGLAFAARLRKRMMAGA